MGANDKTDVEFHNFERHAASTTSTTVLLMLSMADPQ